jgi:hypothetical protein
MVHFTNVLMYELSTNDQKKDSFLRLIVFTIVKITSTNKEIVTLSFDSFMILIDSVDITWLKLIFPFFFFASLFSQLHRILQLEDTCDTSFWSLYLLLCVWLTQYTCATASALW